MKAGLAAEALGQASLGEARAELLAFVVGLLLTFLGVRLNTRLIRARVSWWFHDIERGGTHVHHMVFGVDSRCVAIAVARLFALCAGWLRSSRARAFCSASAWR